MRVDFLVHCINACDVTESSTNGCGRRPVYQVRFRVVMEGPSLLGSSSQREIAGQGRGSEAIEDLQIVFRIQFDSRHFVVGENVCGVNVGVSPENARAENWGSPGELM